MVPYQRAWRKNWHGRVEADKLIIELPAAILRRVITLEATREYLHEVGQR